MPPTFEQSKDAVAQLVKHFATNREQYRAPAYKEAHARQDFIDPLFVALGWDVRNEQRAAPDYREVIFEDSLEIEGQKKAPDYVFRVGRERKFFTEAKKPGVDLKNDARPAYQLRRYAWTAKLPLSLLTDFEELAVYDCRLRPSEKDKAATGRINYYHFQEYADRWRELWDVFSREAVYGGSFDQFAQASKGKRGTSEVDAEFLKEIESWREAFARNLALRNPRLGADELSDSVQRIIDRIIFLRMAEDRGIEDYGRLARLAEGENIYGGLVKLFKLADARYNSGLFDFSKAGDTLTPALKLDDKTLKPILSGLYFPQSPYEFSVLPVELLGNVYEQFLGKVIRLTAGHQAKIEEKPEVKKAGGVYYTPAYIVEYIVKNTLGKQIEGKSPAQLKGFRVLDPACGSGSFLLGAYQYLLDYYLSWYTANAPEKHAKAVWKMGDAWRLTTAEKKRILIEHVYGVDIDRQAVEVTKLSLLLKVLETENDESMGRQLSMFEEAERERALPNLDRNIKCGNSLIGPDYFGGQLLPDAEELKRVNPFDWAAEFPEVFSGRNAGFDCVIGNPPYVFGGNYGIEQDAKGYFKRKFQSGSGKINLFTLLIEKSIEVVRFDGRVSFIIPNTFLRVTSYAKAREFTLKNSAVVQVVDLGGGVFQGAITSSIIIVLRRDRNPTSGKIEIRLGLHNEPQFIPQMEFLRDGYVLNIVTTSSQSLLLDKLQQNSFPLGEVCEELIFGVVITKNRDEVVSEVKRRGWMPFLEGKDIGRYHIRPTSKFLNYEPKLLHRPRTPKIFEAKEKLLIQRITGGSRPLNAAYDSEQYYNKESINNLILKRATDYNIKYILALINSQLINWFYRTRFTNDSTLTVNLSKEYLAQIPIRAINFADAEDKARHDRMVALVQQMLELHKRRAAATGEAQSRLQRLIDATDQQIDALVYELYGLTAEEIAVVEGKSG